MRRDVPIGTIYIWSGSIATIPSRWSLCDGTNKTPNLTDKFIVGSGNTYAVDDTGGNINHNHPFVADFHSHFIPAGLEITSGFGNSPLMGETQTGGITENANGLPPYESLVYIMYTGA